MRSQMAVFRQNSHVRKHLTPTTCMQVLPDLELESSLNTLFINKEQKCDVLNKQASNNKLLLFWENNLWEFTKITRVLCKCEFFGLFYLYTPSFVIYSNDSNIKTYYSDYATS